MSKRIEVAAGVIVGDDGRVLLGQRAPGTFYPGYWEFPGGKVEAGETPRDALVRELEEELGIVADEVRPWIVREHRYEHGHVRLHFFEVPRWHGVLDDKVHAALSWERRDAPAVSPMLPANGPVLKALRLPRRMGITDAARYGVDEQLRRIEAAAACGLEMIQVREPGMSDMQLRDFVARLHDRLEHLPRAPILMINGTAPRVAPCSGCGLHLAGQAAMALSHRPDDFDWVGASCHTRAELKHVAGLGLDYALVGAVKPTPTHPGREGMGWAAFAALIEGLPMPVFALGGLSWADMDSACAAGAHGVAGIRAAWGQAGEAQ